MLIERSLLLKVHIYAAVPNIPPSILYTILLLLSLGLCVTYTYYACIYNEVEGTILLLDKLQHFKFHIYIYYNYNLL